MVKDPPPSAQEIESLRLKWLADYGPKIEPYLERGETLHAICWSDITAVKVPPRRYMPQDGRNTGTPERAENVRSSLVYAPLNGCLGLIVFLGRVPPNFNGGWESQAGRFVIAVSAAAKVNGDELRHLYLAVTDRRLLVAVRPRLASHRGPEPAQLLSAYGPGEVGLRTQEPRGTSDTQIVLGFPDRSYVSVMVYERAGAAALTRFIAPIAG